MLSQNPTYITHADILHQSRVQVAPLLHLREELEEQTVELLILEGTLAGLGERRSDSEGDDDVVGVLLLAVSTWSVNTIRAAFRWWRLRGSSCVVIRRLTSCPRASDPGGTEKQQIEVLKWPLWYVLCMMHCGMRSGEQGGRTGGLCMFATEPRL